MKLNVKDILKPTAILFIICVVVSAALAGTNLLTEDKIEEQAAAKAEESRKLVLPGAAFFEEEENLPADWNGGPVYKAWDQEGEGRSVTGYVFETAAKGYGGDIKVMTGFSYEGDITGVEILSHSETPGLGANAVKEEFREQFKMEKPVLYGPLEVVKYQEPEPGQIEAMTGATITSKAVTAAVEQAQTEFYAITGLE